MVVVPGANGVRALRSVLCTSCQRQADRAVTHAHTFRRTARRPQLQSATSGGGKTGSRGKCDLSKSATRYRRTTRHSMSRKCPPCLRTGLNNGCPDTGSSRWARSCAAAARSLARCWCMRTAASCCVSLCSPSLLAMSQREPLLTPGQLRIVLQTRSGTYQRRGHDALL